MKNGHKCKCFSGCENLLDMVFFEHLAPSNTFEGYAPKHCFIFLTEGSILFSLDRELLKELKSPAMFLLPKDVLYKRVATDQTSMTVIPIENPWFFFSLPNKEEYNNDSPCFEYGYALKINEVVLNFLYLLKDAYAFGLTDKPYIELKMTELLLLIDKTYLLKDRSCFYSSIIDEEFIFANKVMCHYKQVRSVKELAGLLQYSLSGFEKKFKKYFGESASRWLKQQKKTAIYHAILNSNTPLKEISSNYGFCSTTHFNNYCKAAFGETPGKLRKRVPYSIVS